MKPYFDEDGITLYHGDCRDVLPTIAPASVDLIVTDPPYGVAWQSGARNLPFSEMANDNGDFDVHAVLMHALNLLREGRHIYCFGLEDWRSLPIPVAVELIWDKGMAGLGQLDLPWGLQHEKILFGVLVQSKQNRERGSGQLSARLRRGSVLRVPRKNSQAVNRHPTEKPVELLRQLIESSSMLGETVLDPFSGSGSTLVAARIEGRRALGIEIDERYCEVTARRLAQASLFPAASPEMPRNGALEPAGALFGAPPGSEDF